MMQDTYRFLRLLRTLIVMAGLAGWMFVGSGRLKAQSDTGRVTGTVADATGAFIPGATVKIIDTDNGATDSKTTGPDGTFTFATLTRGHYRIESSAAGFATQAENFELQVQQVQTIEFKLNTGQETTTVEVSDAAPVVDLSTSATGATVEGAQVVDLPINGRNFTQLALLTPGVTRGAYNSDASGRNGNVETFRYRDSGGAALSVNGLRQQSNNFLLDGTDNNEALVNTIVFFSPPEAIQEFHVTTSVAPAEFGRAGGAIINNSIRSGTNKVHGSVFGFYRSDVFDANPNYFSPTTTKPNFQRKQYGASLGGPLWKDRIFLFGDYQALRQKRPNSASFVTVPTAKMRTGDFSELLGNAVTTLPDPTLTGCTSVTTASGATYATTGTDAQTIFNASPDKGAIFDPTTCSQFASGGAANVIPTARANPAGLKYLQAFDNPTRAGLTQNFYNVRNALQNYDDFDVRLDVHASTRDTLFARFSYAQDSFPVNSEFSKLPAGYGSGSNINRPRGGAFGYDRVFSASVVNEFRFGITRPEYAYVPPFEGVPVSANLGIVNANRNALLGGGALIGGNGSELEYTGDYGPYSVPQKMYQYADNVTWTHRDHTFKTGVNYIRRGVSFFQGNAAKGSFVIGGVNYPGTGRFTGYETSELLSGFSDYQIGAASTYFKTHNIEEGFYAQDDWKVTPRLTLNLGARYDLYTWPYEENNNQANYDIGTGTLLIAGQNGNSRSLIATDKNNVAPRIGFAYDVFGNGKTSLRGGYGMFFFLDRGGVANQLSNNPGYNGQFVYPASAGYRITLTGQVAQGTDDSSAAQTALPLPAFGPSPALAADPGFATVIAQLPKNQNGDVQEWNLQVQHQLDQYTSATVAYVGTTSHHLMTWFNLNSPVLNGTGSGLYPTRGTIDEGCACGASNYNGLQISLNRNVAKGLTATAAYTYSHTLDNSNGAFNSGTSGAGTRIFITPGGPNLLANYGNSDQDQRQVFVTSALWRLPFGHGMKFGHDANWALDELLGGWQINPLFTLATGTPIDFTTGGGTPDDRPDLISYKGVSRAQAGGGGNSNNLTYFTAVMALPPVNASGVYTRPGDLGRNRFFGPGYDNLDVSAFKSFNVKDRAQIELRAQAFNLFNHPEFNGPDTNIRDGFATSTGAYSSGINSTTGNATNFGTINSIRDSSERQVEFAVRVSF